MTYLSREERQNLNRMPIRQRRSALSAVWKTDGANCSLPPLSLADRYWIATNAGGSGPDNPSAPQTDLSRLFTAPTAWLHDDRDATDIENCTVAWRFGGLIEKTGRERRASSSPAQRAWGFHSPSWHEVKPTALGARVIGRAAP